MYDGRYVGLGVVRRHMEKKKVDYPVLHDASGRVAQELGVRFYPAAFLVGSDGKVVWEGALTGETVRRKVAALIEQELRRGVEPEDKGARG